MRGHSLFEDERGNYEAASRFAHLARRQYVPGAIATSNTGAIVLPVAAIARSQC